MPIESLWGKIQTIPTTSSPKRILEEQASTLASETGNLLLGEVRPIPGMSGLAFKFDIVVPTLMNYRYTILSADYSAVSLYPVHLDDHVNRLQLVAGTEDEFKERLKEIFQSTNVQSAIGALLLQANDG